ncbi:MAG: DUF1573 domain-containing protein [Chitinophagales bacterium]|nr:DUF1573 domain-containing protein [Chitinophagales bacterium]
MIRLLTLVFCFCLNLVSSQAQQINTTDKTQNAGKVEWIEQHYDVGKVPYEPVVREYHFKNVSKEKLIIQKVNTGCHCTVADYPQEPIAPGATGVIKLTFTPEQTGSFYRIIMVYTNFAPDQAVFYALTGKIDEKKQ